MTTTRAAEMLGVSNHSVIEWARKGLIPCWRTPGGHRRFRIEDIEAFLDAPQSQATEPV